MEGWVLCRIWESEKVWMYDLYEVSMCLHISHFVLSEVGWTRVV